MSQHSKRIQNSATLTKAKTRCQYNILSLSTDNLKMCIYIDHDHLPGHSLCAQLSTSFLSPVHAAPCGATGSYEQILVLNRKPPPQVALHCDQNDQLLHEPSTYKNNTNYQ